MKPLISTADHFAGTSLLPALNIGGGFDIPTGRYIKLDDGSHILDGGYAPFTAAAGDGNTYKSTLTTFFSMSALNRYGDWWPKNIDTHIRVELMVYDSEFSKKIGRYEDLAVHFRYLSNEYLPKNEINPTGTIIITNGSVGADDYFEGVKKWADMKTKGAKSQTWYTAPFVDGEGKHIKMPVPTINEWDSISMARADAMAEQFDGNSIGDSKNNTEAMRDGLIKNRIIMRLPTLSYVSAMYTTIVAHLGKEIQMDARMPPEKHMAFLKQHIKFKNAPEKIKFLPNNLYMTSKPMPHWVSSSNKTVKYPRHAKDNIAGDTDLQRVTVINLRGKSGPSGLPFEIIVSQRDGFQASLTEHHYCLGKKMYGMTGKDITDHVLDLMPDIKLTRTTVRMLLETNYLLQRAMEITMEFCQMTHQWLHLVPGHIPTPKDLVNKLTDKGFNMEILLNTRGWWLFNEIKHPLPILTSWDLIEMYHTDWKPTWYDKAAKLKEKEDANSTV